MNNKWRLIKNSLVIFTAIIVILIPIICFHLLPNINILFEPLSKFGIEPQTKFIWKAFLVVLSIMLYLTNDNLIDDVKENIKIYQYKLLGIINLISSLSLALTGIVDMKTKLLHLSFATIFFFAYTGYMTIRD